MKLPALRPSVVALRGGVDLVEASMAIRPGYARIAFNYEAAVDGGYQLLGGFERFDGRPKPSDAIYRLLTPGNGFHVVPVGSTLTGIPSGATGVVCASTPEYVAVTKASGTFADGDVLRVGSVDIGVFSTDVDYPISFTLDGQLLSAAAAQYRADITAVPGGGPVRGVEFLNGTVYAWRDDAATSPTALRIYKSTASGWTLVPLMTELGFTGGSVAPTEGATITKGGASATVKRVVLESGTWGAGTAAGRLIVTGITGGPFTSGALSTGGTLNLAATLTGSLVQAAITLQPGGRVFCDTYNFTASVTTRRLYGCDGVNREFEFDGETLVPINTGVTIRAKVLKCHRNNLILALASSLQVSALGNPYSFSVNLGAAELGAGDTITNLVSVGGSESSAAMLALCQSSVWVLYGDSGSFRFQRLSERRGGNMYSAQDVGNVLVHDTMGFATFSPTQDYGNLNWSPVSRPIEPLVKEKIPTASVFVKSLTRYRCFFSDGTGITGTPMRTRDGVMMAWMPVLLPVNVQVATSAEYEGRTLTFYGDDQGFVYEADVGRSFDGALRTSAIKLAPLYQGNAMLDKGFKFAFVETTADGPFTLLYSAEFDEGASGSDVLLQLNRAVGGGLGLYDLARWDRAHYDTEDKQALRLEIEGEGHSVAPIFSTSSDFEPQHTLKAVTIMFTARKVRR